MIAVEGTDKIGRRKEQRIETEWSRLETDFHFRFLVDVIVLYCLCRFRRLLIFSLSSKTLSKIFWSYCVVVVVVVVVICFSPIHWRSYSNHRLLVLSSSSKAMWEGRGKRRKEGRNRGLREKGRGEMEMYIFFCYCRCRVLFPSLRTMLSSSSQSEVRKEGRKRDITGLEKKRAGHN